MAHEDSLGTVLREQYVWTARGFSLCFISLDFFQPGTNEKPFPLFFSLTFLLGRNRSEQVRFSLATTDPVLHLKHSRLPRRLPVASSANHIPNKVWHLSAAHFMVVIHGRTVVSRHYLLIKHALSAPPNGQT